MNEKKHSNANMREHRKEKAIKSKSVAKKVLAGTIGLSLLQVPLFASAVNAGVSGTNTATASTSVQSVSPTQQALNPADAKITKSEAEARIRSLLPLLKEAKLNSVEYGEQNVYPQNTKKVWVLSWSIEQGNGSMGFSTEVDAITGDILNYYYPLNPNTQDSSYYPPTINEQEAKKIAEDFIPKAAPSIKSGDLKPSDQISYVSNKSLFGPVQYYFTYSVQVNGIPSDSENVNVAIDGKGQVINFNRARFQGEYPSVLPSITKAEAEKQLKSNLSLSLAYIPSSPLYSRGPANNIWRLGYIPDRTLTAIDAKTGKNIDLIYGKESDMNEAITYTSLEPSKHVFTPNQGKQLTSEEAAELLSAIAPNSKDYALQSNLNNFWPNSKTQVWNLYWNKRNSMGMGDNKNATINAETGQLLNYYESRYPVSEEENKKVVSPTITEADARNKAIDLVQAFYPDAAQVLKLSNAPAVIKSSTKTSYQFSFQRFYKDSLIYSNVVSITLDGSGKLMSYSTNDSLEPGYEKTLDSLTAKLKKEDALQTFNSGLGTELRYIISGGYNIDSSYADPTVQLGYVPTFNGDRNLPYVNAITGKTENYYENLSSENAGKAALPSDAASHAASKDLATLMEYQVLAPAEDGLLHPDAELKLGDWLLMMSKGVNPNQDYYGYNSQSALYSDVPADSPYASAVQLFTARGWLSETKSTTLHPEQTLTREMLATSLTAILHYNRLSKFFQEDAQTLTLTDAASIKDKGEVALVTKLGLMTAPGGKFEPAKPVTKADAASIMVRMAQLQGKVDVPIMQY